MSGMTQVPDHIKSAFSVYNDFADVVSFDTSSTYPVAEVWDDSDVPKIVGRFEIRYTLKPLPVKE